MPKTNRAFIIDVGFQLHSGNFGYKKACKCAELDDYERKVLSFDEDCKVVGCEGGWVYLNAKGFRTGGLFKVANLSQTFLNNGYEVDLIFDPPKEDLDRTSTHADYKGNRGEKSDHMKLQSALALKFFPMFDRLNCFIGIQDEADDVMAVRALEYKDKGYSEIVVATDDKDLFPVLSYGINLFRQGTIFTEDDFVRKFGFSSSRFDEYLAIIGDSADNFNLIKGLGPVAATYILENHDHVLDIFKDEHWCNLPKKYKNKLVKVCEETKKEIKLIDELELSYQLAQLNLKAPYKQIKNEVSLAEIHEQLKWLEFNQMSNNLNLFMENIY